MTGAAGLTGGEVVRALAARGFQVRALVRSAEQRRQVDGAAEIVVGDCRDSGRMVELINGCDAVVHVAGIQLGAALARVPELREAASLVVVSSAGVYSRHRSSAVQYRAGEDALRAAHPRAVIVRPTMIYGSAQDRNVHHVIAFARKFRCLPIVGRGRALVQPIHYVDLAHALIDLVAVPGPLVIDAGGEAALTMRDAARAIFDGLQIAPRFVPVPFAAAMTGATVVDHMRATRWRERVERMLEDRTADNRSLIGNTGVRPRSFPAGVREEIASLGR